MGLSSIGGTLIQIESRNIMETFRKWWFAGIDLIFPLRCVGCGQAGVVLCDNCESAIQPISPPVCKTCGSPNPRSPRRCDLCIEYPQGLQVRAFAKYRGPVHKAILHLKYRPSRNLAHIMGRWLSEVARRERWKPDLIIPVPLGNKRLRSRGYNQASLIAQGLADHLNLALCEDLLIRGRETISQVGLDPLERKRNVHRAFQTSDELNSELSVLLVDDLVTTGATLSACAEALQDAGARRVYGLAVARA
jgi:ComF family protein